MGRGRDLPVLVASLAGTLLLRLELLKAGLADLNFVSASPAHVRGVRTLSSSPSSMIQVRMGLGVGGFES